MSGPQDAGELLDRVRRALIDRETAAIEALRRAGEACDAVDDARNAGDTDDARAAARCREAVREWHRAIGQADAFCGLVAEVVEMGVHPFSRAEQAERRTGHDRTAVRQRDDTRSGDHGRGHDGTSRGRAL